jgi:hypothetical protein
MPKALMLAFTKPVSAAVEDEYNRWYTGKHLPDLTKVPGLISATRYKLDNTVEAMPGVSGDPRGYLALYEIEGDSHEDLANFAKSLTEAINAGNVDISPALDMTNMSASFLLPISERMVAKGKS